MISHDNVPLVVGRGSFAHLSRSPSVATAVIFVHGFKGHPATTWCDFQTLTNVGLKRGWWAECDLYFYGYDSFGPRIAVNAVRFGDLIRRLFPTPDWNLFKPDDRPVRNALSVDLPPRPDRADGRRYSHLVVVAHSEGAVVVRKCILDAAKQYTFGQSPVEPWQVGLLNSTLCLFAPALMGVCPSGWKGVVLAVADALPHPLRAVIGGWLGASAAYRELQPGCRVLATLQDSTEELWSENPYLFGLQASICWGMREDVVAVGEYRHDWPVLYLEKQNHVSVCKPNSDYTAPLEFVLRNYERQRTTSRTSAQFP